MMKQYLIEKPEYAKKIEDINVKLNDLMRNTSYDKNPEPQQNQE